MRTLQNAALYEHVDITGRGNETLFTYQWILDAPYAARAKLVPHGWKWLRGRPGAYITNDYALAKQTEQMYQTKPIASNGTHAAQTAPMYEDGLDRTVY